MALQCYEFSALGKLREIKDWNTTQQGNLGEEPAVSKLHNLSVKTATNFTHESFESLTARAKEQRNSSVHTWNDRAGIFRLILGIHLTLESWFHCLHKLLNNVHMLLYRKRFLIHSAVVVAKPNRRLCKESELVGQDRVVLCVIYASYQLAASFIKQFLLMPEIAGV